MEEDGRYMVNQERQYDWVRFEDQVKTQRRGWENQQRVEGMKVLKEKK